jgi:hypothetical protein
MRKESIFLFGSTGTWTQGLHLEPLCQRVFVMGIFEIGSRELFAQAGFKPPSSWVARIAGVSQLRPAEGVFQMLHIIVMTPKFPENRWLWVSICPLSTQSSEQGRGLPLLPGKVSSLKLQCHHSLWQQVMAATTVVSSGCLWKGTWELLASAMLAELGWGCSPSLRTSGKAFAPSTP